MYINAKIITKYNQYKKKLSMNKQCNAMIVLKFSIYRSFFGSYLYIESGLA